MQLKSMGRTSSQHEARLININVIKVQHGLKLLRIPWYIDRASSQHEARLYI
jgi:hypothetical protein